MPLPKLPPLNEEIKIRDPGIVAAAKRAIKARPISRAVYDVLDDEGGLMTDQQGWIELRDRFMARGEPIELIDDLKHRVFEHFYGRPPNASLDI